MRYWGIWIPEAKVWLKSTEGLIYFPLKSIADAYLNQMTDEWWKDQNLQVKEFDQDEDS